jgi:insulysin
VAEKLQALSKLEADSLAKFVPHLLSKTFLECYVQGWLKFHVNQGKCISNYWTGMQSHLCLSLQPLVGNIEPGEAESIVQEIEDTIFNTPNSVLKSMSPSQYLIKRVIMLENELKCYYQIEGLNMKNENSSIVQYIQV